MENRKPENPLDFNRVTFDCDFGLSRTAKNVITLTVVGLVALAGAGALFSMKAPSAPAATLSGR